MGKEFSSSRSFSNGSSRFSVVIITWAFHRNTQRRGRGHDCCFFHVCSAYQDMTPVIKTVKSVLHMTDTVFATVT